MALSRAGFAIVNQYPPRKTLGLNSDGVLDTTEAQDHTFMSLEYRTESMTNRVGRDRNDRLPIRFYFARELNLGPHACESSALTTAPFCFTRQLWSLCLLAPWCSCRCSWFVVRRSFITAFSLLGRIAALNLRDAASSPISFLVLFSLTFSASAYFLLHICFLSCVLANLHFVFPSCCSFASLHCFVSGSSSSFLWMSFKSCFSSMLVFFLSCGKVSRKKLIEI